MDGWIGPITAVRHHAKSPQLWNKCAYDSWQAYAYGSTVVPGTVAAIEVEIQAYDQTYIIHMKDLCTVVAKPVAPVAH